MGTDRPRAIVLAGPNGSGKSTSASELLRRTWEVEEFVNADLIAQGLNALGRSKLPWRRDGS